MTPKGMVDNELDERRVDKLISVEKAPVI